MSTGRKLTLTVLAALIAAPFLLILLPSEVRAPLTPRPEVPDRDVGTDRGAPLIGNAPDFAGQPPSDDDRGEIEDRLFVTIPATMPFSGWTLRILTPGGEVIADFSSLESLGVESSHIDLPADTDQLRAVLTRGFAFDANRMIAEVEVTILPTESQTIRAWSAVLPCARIRVSADSQIDAEYFSARCFYEDGEWAGDLWNGSEWDGSTFATEVLAGTYTLSGSWSVEGEMLAPPDTLETRVVFNPPTVVAAGDEPVDVTVSLQAFPAWLPVDLGGRSVRHVYALPPDGPRFALDDDALFFPEFMQEVPVAPNDYWERVKGWWLADDGKLYVAPDEAGSRAGLDIGPTAVVELEDGNFVVFDAKDRDPARGGTIVPDSDTTGRQGAIVEIINDGTEPVEQVELRFVYGREFGGSTLPTLLTFRRTMTVPVGRSFVHVPDGYTAWLKRVVVGGDDNSTKVLTPAEEESLVGTTRGGPITDGSSLTIRLGN